MHLHKFLVNRRSHARMGELGRFFVYFQKPDTESGMFTFRFRGQCSQMVTLTYEQAES
jgi:hypothetical protein